MPQDTQNGQKGAETLEDPPVSWGDINATKRTSTSPHMSSHQELRQAPGCSPVDARACSALPPGALSQWGKRTPCSTALQNICHHQQDSVNGLSAPMDAVNGAKQGAWVNLGGSKIDFQIIAQSIVIEEEKRPEQS